MQDMRAQQMAIPSMDDCIAAASEDDEVNEDDEDDDADSSDEEAPAAGLPLEVRVVTAHTDKVRGWRVIISVLLIVLIIVLVLHSELRSHPPVRGALSPSVCWPAPPLPPLAIDKEIGYRTITSSEPRCDLDYGFHASSAEASGLFVGCHRTVSATEAANLTLPDLIIIGVQKGGTTSFEEESHSCSCWPSRELHFFDDHEFVGAPVSLSRLREYAAKWPSCQAEMQHRLEKTPNYYYAQHVPLRMCEALGAPKLAILLRDPIKRAWSGYFQGLHVVPLPRTAEGFDAFARAEIEITNSCSRAAEATFRGCCEAAVARALGLNGASWPGCNCTTPPAGDALDTLDRHYGCSVYGDKRAAAVRMGLYARSLRTWFRYHRPEQLLIFRSEDFFEHKAVLREALCFADPSRAAGLAPPRAWDAEARIHVNSKGARQEMLRETEQLLRSFYSPHNQELDRLLGRGMRW